jgi:hypothetical protein
MKWGIKIELRIYPKLYFSYAYNGRRLHVCFLWLGLWVERLEVLP